MPWQRRYERVPFFCPLRVIVPEGVSAPGGSFDVSLGGVGITTKISLECGQAVRVRFYLKNGGGERSREEVLGRVANVRADEDGNCLGVEFLEPIRASTNPLLARAIEKL